MIRRVRTWTGKKTHAARGIAWDNCEWKGKTFCSLKIGRLLTSAPGFGHEGIIFGSTEPIDCSYCRRAVQSIIDNVQNALAGFST